MTASKRAKKIGVSTLKKASVITGVPLSTLDMWNKTKRPLFDVLMVGVAEIEHLKCKMPESWLDSI